MIEQVHELAQLLRANGVAVAPGRVIDAGAALAAVGVAERAVVHAALRVTLVSAASDLAAFDELFAMVFDRGRPAIPLEDLTQRLIAAGVAPALAAKLAEALAADARSLLARGALGLRPLDLRGLLAAAGAAGEVGPIHSPLQVGFLAYRLAEQLGLDAEERAALAGLERVGRTLGLDDAGLEHAGGVVREAFARIRGALRDHLDARFRREHLDFAGELALRSLGRRPFGQLRHEDLPALRAEVARLARVLRARLDARPSHRRRGRLDLGRTLRRSLATGGVPFVLRHKPREPRRPRLVVLCDVSDSVRNVSRFTLELTYALHDLWDHVYSFAFVAELGELTALFREHDVGRAIELAYGGAVISTFANSDYGEALGRFCDRHLAKVNRRTTVLVIGDGRSNYHPPRAGLLGTIRRRARQVVWITPEPPSAWGFGDSAMRDYAPHCDRVAVAYDLDTLRRVIDDLVA